MAPRAVAAVVTTAVVTAGRAARVTRARVTAGRTARMPGAGRAAPTGDAASATARPTAPAVLGEGVIGRHEGYGCRERYAGYEGFHHGQLQWMVAPLPSVHRRRPDGAPRKKDAKSGGQASWTATEAGSLPGGPRDLPLPRPGIAMIGG